MTWVKQDGLNQQLTFTEKMPHLFKYLYISKCKTRLSQINISIFLFLSDLSWKLLYSVKSGSTALDAQLQEDIPQATLTQFVTLKVTGSSDKYMSSLVQNPSETYRYYDLFPVYFSGRVSETDYSQIEAGLVTVWNSELQKAVAQSADILRQEEVITGLG